MERDWAGLPLDVLASIFAKLGVDDVMRAGLVCHPWLGGAKVPDLWRFIDMAYFKIMDLSQFNRVAMDAVHRADGRLEAFEGFIFVTDELLRYVADRSPSLKSLTVIGSSEFTNEALRAIVDGCPRLEDLHVIDCIGVTVDRALKAKCAGIKTLELIPYDAGLLDHTYYSETEYDTSDDNDDD